MTLTADRSAPVRYSDKGSRKVANNHEVKRCAGKARNLTAELRRKYGSVRNAPATDPATQEKASADAALHALKENLRNKTFARDRKRHFRNADTRSLKAQFNQTAGDRSVVGNMTLVRPTKYNIPERADVVRILCDQVSTGSEDEKLARRMSVITKMAALCTRQESIRHRQPEATPNCVGLSSLLDAIPEVAEETKCEEMYPLVCRPTQCPICIGDERKPHGERTREFTRPSVMMDHVDSHFLKHINDAPIGCHHPICRAEGLILGTLMEFKNHTAQVHKIVLRA